MKQQAETCIERLNMLIGADFVIPTETSEDLPLRLAVIGQPHQNLFGILAAHLKEWNTLDRSLPRGYRCTVAFGEIERINVINAGEHHVVSDEELCQFLTTFDKSGQPVCIEIQLPNEMLKNLQIDLIASSEDYDDIDFYDILTQHDYFLFALTSTALLSMTERKILRTYLLEYASSCIGILLTADHLILDSDRPDLEGVLSRFFRNDIPMFRLPEHDEAVFADFLDNLPSQIKELREQRVQIQYRLLLEQAQKAADVQAEVLSSDSNRLDEAVALLNDKMKRLPGRKEYSCRRVRMKYLSKMKLDASQRISDFQYGITEKLHGEIEKADDVQKLQNILPRYINDQWVEQSKRIANDAERNMKSISAELEEFLKSDIRDYLENDTDTVTADYINRIAELYIKNPKSNATFEAQNVVFDASPVQDGSKRSRYGAIATGVALVLLSHPITGVAVAVFGAKYFGDVSKDKFVSESKSSLVEAADAMCRDMYDEMVVWLDELMNNIEKRITESIELCYDRIMTMLLDALKERKNDSADYHAQLSEISELRLEIESLLKQVS